MHKPPSGAGTHSQSPSRIYHLPRSLLPCRRVTPRSNGTNQETTSTKTRPACFDSRTVNGSHATSTTPRDPLKGPFTTTTTTKTYHPWNEAFLTSNSTFIATLMPPAPTSPQTIITLLPTTSSDHIPPFPPQTTPSNPAHTPQTKTKILREYKVCSASFLSSALLGTHIRNEIHIESN